MKISELIGAYNSIGAETAGRFITLAFPKQTQTLTAAKKSALKAVAQFAVRNDGQSTPLVSSVLQDLSRANEIGRALKATAFAKDCDTLIQLLKPLGEQSLDCVAKAIADGPAKPSKNAKTAKLTDVQIRTKADELAIASGSAEAGILIDEIGKLPAAQVKKVAEIYLGFELGRRTKLKILEEMKRRNQSDAIDRSRHGRESVMTY